VRLATAGDFDVAVEHRDPCVLLDLVLAQGLARREHDQDGAGAVVGVEDVRVAGAVRGIELEQVPVLHRVAER
jgi:hypothetical protein